MLVMHGLLLFVVAICSLGSATVAPLADDVKLIENFKTELYLDLGSYQIGGPIVISPYATSADGQKWTIVSNTTQEGEELYAFASVASGNYIFVNGTEGEGLIARSSPTLFTAVEIKLITYAFTIPFTSLAITAPERSGEQVTLQEFNGSNIAQHWAIINT